MVKLLLISLIYSSILFAQEPSEALEKNCLICHQKQQIPSELIYRRYLLKYSDLKTIKEQMFSYLQDPKRENSIMPKQFFLKFSMKKMLDLNTTLLRDGVEAYIDFFDIKKRLIIRDRVTSD